MKIWLPWRGTIDSLCIWSPLFILLKALVNQPQSASFCWWSSPINSLSPSTMCLPGIYGWNWLGWSNSAELFSSTEVQQSLEKAFCYGLEVCLLNAFTIMKKVRQTPQDFLTFRIAIVRHLLEGKCFRAQPGRPPTRTAVDMDARRFNRQYHAISVEQDRRDCVVCAKGSFCLETEPKPQIQDKHCVRSLWPQASVCTLQEKLLGKVALTCWVLVISVPSVFCSKIECCIDFRNVCMAVVQAFHIAFDSALTFDVSTSYNCMVFGVNK